MITILEAFLTEFERGGGWGGGKSDYKDCFRSQKKTLDYTNVFMGGS